MKLFLFTTFIVAIAAARDINSPIVAVASTTARPTPIAAYSNPFQRYNNRANDHGRYNQITGQYEQYNPYTGRYDANYSRYNQNAGIYQNNWNNGKYNPHSDRYEYNSRLNSRYNPQIGRIENWRDRQYYQNTEFGRKFSPEYYGRGSVNPVHVPIVHYNDESKWNILRDDRQSNGDDYHYSYETENGIRAAEDSHLENKHTPAETNKKTGFYEYVGDDGKTYRVDYVADENGFRAKGAHLPTSPPIPDYIQRSLDYIAAKQLERSSKLRG